MSSLKISFVGFKELIAALNLRIGKVRYAQGALRKVGQAEIDAAQERLYRTKTSPDGVPWSPWAESTRIAREREGNAGRGLLFNSGRLMNSFQLEINTNTVIVKNVAPYAAYLQEGTDKMPARPYFGWSEASKQRITTIFNDYLKATVIEGKDYP